ncbi:DegT/DnrJ/EryC1/StrS family aminotransferase [Alphaproteobacteria bacterium]|nr:DegT/DnrJ/EryC1/StrS family aminotransferase [Alphaproteobacteria bacterium]MDB2406722.1 DegT/DnrJ/EryC1/StrS family aminotransferase [Alphaproteobacteria bacterium]MDB2540620.1 DegT/DnrJ/EryC1/StrS family aminotransferase [Alphaproteobacteria bacterium]MDB2649021.1 DegT/DnrJ/EryC1/StrS family aminotransferase [Alphaproteobacteria bacterium]
MYEKIRVANPSIPQNYLHKLSGAIQKGFISSSSPYVAEFENSMAQLCGRKHAMSCSSGTQAIKIAIKALELTPGTEVILPNFCIISVLIAVLDNQLVPKFVDPSDGYNVRLDDIIPRISNQTGAIIVAHMYGLSVNIIEIQEFCKEKNIFLIEDAAEAHGQTCNSLACGGFGDISTFSFFSNKHVTCGEGGMCLTNNELLANKIKKIKNLYFDSQRSYKHNHIGEVGRLTTMQAVLGLCSLEKLSDTINKKSHIAQLYAKHLDGTVILPTEENAVSTNHYWVYPITFDDEKQFTKVKLKLDQSNIEYRRIFYPLSMQPLLSPLGYSLEYSKVLDDLYHRSMYIPIGPNITDSEIEYVADNIKTCL